MKKLDKPLFNKFIQVGILVKDLKESMERYLKYGMGPWYVLEFNSRTVDKMMLYGKRKGYAMLVAACPMGDVRFELIQPLTESIYTDYIDKNGYSIIHHIKLGVDDYDFTVKYLHEIGIKSIQSGHQIGTRGENIYNYFETSQSLGFLLEIAKVTKDFVKPPPDYWYPVEEFKASSIFKKPSGFTLITSDLKDMIKNYSEIFGMNRWEMIDYYDKKNRDSMTARGHSGCSLNACFHKVGGKELKIKELKEKDNSIFSDFKKKYGIGVIHSLCIYPFDFDRARKMLLSYGKKFLQTGNYLKKSRFTYIDTSDDLNFITELIDSGEKMLP